MGTLERHTDLRADVLAFLHSDRPPPRVAPRLLLHRLHPTRVVSRPLLAVAQDLIRLRDLLELLRAAALVCEPVGWKGEGGLGSAKSSRRQPTWVMPERQRPVSLLHLLRIRER